MTASASRISAAEARAYIRCAWLATDPVTTSTTHHRRRPDSTAQPAASAARKNIAPNHGFQNGCSAITGCHVRIPTMTPAATRPPHQPAADHAASTASEHAIMQHRAAPHSTPYRGSRWTGTACSQYCRGPGSNAPSASRVACPTSGPCAVRTSHDRTAIAAPSPTGRQRSRTACATPLRNGAHTTRCTASRNATARLSTALAPARTGARLYIKPARTAVCSLIPVIARSALS